MYFSSQSMDIEKGHVLMAPPVCEACMSRQGKNSQRKTITFCLSIAYNIVLLFVLFVAMIYFHDFKARLESTEKIIQRLQLQDLYKDQQETHTKVNNYAGETLSPEFALSEKDNDTEVHVQDDIRAVKIPYLRVKRGNRRKKRCKNCLPVVQIEGSDGEGHANKKDLSDLWKTPAEFLPTGRKAKFDVSAVSSSGKIKVKEGGLYLLYAQMNLVGPSIKGFEVFKEDHNSAPECITTCKRNSQQTFTENCYTMKMTLAGAYKRGYLVRLERDRQISTVATCALYVDEDVAASDTSYMLRTCPTMRTVPLKKNDRLFIEELDDNSKAQYSKFSVFGLIKVGATAENS